MNHIELTRDFEYLNSRYRITYFEFGGLIKMEKLIELSWWQSLFRMDGQDRIWRTLYDGHIEPIQEAVKVFELAKKLKENT